MGKYCGNCGTQMAQDEKFCAICGTKFESNIKTVKSYSKKQLTPEVIKKDCICKKVANGDTFSSSLFYYLHR